MDKQSEQLRPVILAAIVAIAGTAGILYSDFGPSNGSRGGDSARMITATAVTRAGAIEIPTESRAGGPAP